MAVKGYLLSEADRAKIQAILKRESDRPVRTPNRPAVEDPLGESPEVYIAKTPDGGIPALTIYSMGTADMPGSADCDIYRVVDETSGGLTQPGLELLTVDDTTTRTVYNLSTTALAADTWILVARDKFGTWTSTGGSGGGGSPLTVEQVDDSVSVSNVTKLEFDQSTGLKLRTITVSKATDPAVVSVSGATGSGVSPIVLTVSDTSLFVTGDSVVIASVGGNTAANGNHTVTVTDSTHLTLPSTTGNGNYTSGGTVQPPIVLTVSSTATLTTGDSVTVTGVGGNTAANGTWTIIVSDLTHIRLNNSVPNGAYTSGGTVNLTGDAVVYFDPAAQAPPISILVNGTAPNANGWWTGRQYNFDVGTQQWVKVNLSPDVDDSWIRPNDNVGTTENEILITGNYYEATALNQITTITNTTGNTVNPIVVTAASHGLVSGEQAIIKNVLGNTAANGTWTVTVLTSNTFSIPATGNGTFSSGTPVPTVEAVKTYFMTDQTGINLHYFQQQGGTNTQIIQATEDIAVDTNPANTPYLTVIHGPPTTPGATIIGANGTPILIQTSGHSFVTGDVVNIANVLGNTAANGSWTVTVLSSTAFTLNGSASNGIYSSGGTATLQSAPQPGRTPYTIGVGLIGFNGTVQRVTDVVCNDGVFTATINLDTYVNGVLKTSL